MSFYGHSFSTVAAQDVSFSVLTHCNEPILSPGSLPGEILHHVGSSSLQLVLARGSHTTSYPTLASGLEV